MMLSMGMARERALAARLGRTVASSRQPNDDAAGDIGDESVSDELKDEQLAGAETDSTTLDLIHDALNRIEAGTYATAVAMTTPRRPMGQPNTMVKPVMPLLPPNPVSLRNISSIAT